MINNIMVTTTITLTFIRFITNNNKKQEIIRILIIFIIIIIIMIMIITMHSFISRFPSFLPDRLTENATEKQAKMAREARHFVDEVFFCWERKHLSLHGDGSK